MANDVNAQKAQNMMNRGRQALESKKFDLAIEMLTQSLAYAPDVLETRKLLRTAQIGRFKQNPSYGLGAKMGAFFARNKINGLIKKGQAAEAMAEAEKLLSQNPLDSDNIEIAVKAAEAAGKPEAAAITVEAAAECSSGDAALLLRVANYYALAKNWLKARDAYQKLLKLKPGDQHLIQQLKNAEAQATMNSGWTDVAGKKGGYQALIANKEQAKKLDQANKAMVVGDDAESMIQDRLAAIEKEPGNMNNYRALARIYAQNKRFDEAVDILSKAVNLGGSMDPELDKMLSNMKLQAYDQKIDALREAGDEDGANALEQEKIQFKYEDLSGRVERYPNDLKLRYDLGVLLYDFQYYDDALTHLQLAQKSPKERLWALYYMAMCFIATDKTDMAVMQLEAARDAIPTMDELKKKVVYQLGLCAEAQGDLDKAYAYYKDIYSSDVTFADLGERMLAISNAKKNG